MLYSLRQPSSVIIFSPSKKLASVIKLQVLFEYEVGFIKADNGKVTEGIEYESGKRVEIPINKDGSVKWFDDNKLLKNV